MKSRCFVKIARDMRLVVLCLAVVLAGGLKGLADDSKLNQRSKSVNVTPGSTAFLRSQDDGASFDFETDLMQGTIRTGGAYHGISRLVDKRTGEQVIDSRYSALNLFKLMSVNQAMDQPRTMPRTVDTTGHAVEIKWAPTETHRAEIAARYEVVQPNAVDVTVTVRSQGSYRGYELFMSSYFDKKLRPHVYVKPRSQGTPQLVLPMVSDVFRGTVLVFPRDAHAARLCLDGRWDRKERSTPTVQMCPVRHYGYCLALLVHPDQQLGVVLMADPRDCYAFSTRYFAENDADRLTDYSAFDHSLFGVDLVPTTVRTVKVRLALTGLDDKLSQPLKMYQEFLSETDERRDQSSPSLEPGS